MTNILFLQSFHLHSGLSWNGPAGAPPSNFMLLLFAGIILLFRNPNERYSWRFVSPGVLLHLVSPETIFVSNDWGMVRAIFSFFAGCLVYELRLSSRKA